MCVDNWSDAAYPESSGGIATTADQRSTMAHEDMATAVESETGLYNAHRQIRVYECKIRTRKYKCTIVMWLRS